MRVVSHHQSCFPSCLESTALIPLMGEIVLLKFDVGNQAVKWIIQPRATPPRLGITDAWLIDPHHL